MTDNASLMPEQVSLFARSVTDPVWGERLTSDDDTAHLGETYLVNGLVTPTRLAVTSLISPQAVAGAGQRLATLTQDAGAPLLGSPASGLPAAPAYWEVAVLARTTGIGLDRMPPEYASWRFSTEVYVLYGGAVYLVQGANAIRHRVLSGDEVGLTFVQRLLPFVEHLPQELTGSMVFLVSIPARFAALGGLRGHRRALLEAGAAGRALAESCTAEAGTSWTWETEFYDDAAARLLGVDGVERVVTHVGYQHLAAQDDDADDGPRDEGES